MKTKYLKHKNKDGEYFLKIYGRKNILVEIKRNEWFEITFCETGISDTYQDIKQLGVEVSRHEFLLFYCIVFNKINNQL